MPWSQWSLTVRSCFGEFNQTATRLFAAGGNKRGRSDHRRQHDDDRSGETTFNTAVLCACIDLQEECAASGSTSSQRLRVRGVETAVQKVWTASSGEIPWYAPSSFVIDEVSRVEAVGPSVSDRQSARPATRDARRETAEFLRARQACAVSGSANPTDLVSLGSREGDESAKPKEYFNWGKPGHGKSEDRYFSAVRKKQLARQDKADRHTAGDPEMGKTEFLGERGTSVL